MLAHPCHSNEFAFFWRISRPGNSDQTVYLRRKCEACVDAAMLKLNMLKSRRIEPSEKGSCIKNEASKYQLDRKVAKIDTL